MYILCLSVLSWVFACLFVSNKHQNDWTNPAQILCATSHDPREGLWMIKIKKLVSNKILFSLNWKPRNYFYKIRELFLFLFYNAYKEKMFTIEIEDGRKAVCKPGTLWKCVAETIEELWEWNTFKARKTGICFIFLIR